MSKIRLAILGCGGMAGAHARGFVKHPEVEIVALSDVSQEILHAFIEKNLEGYEPRPATFTDRAQMYAEAKPDAVVIVTPHTMHYDHAVQALDAGCHVLLEKPMVTDTGDAYALAQKVEESGKVFVIGYNTPCSPAINYVREAVRSGEFGKLQLISGWLSQGWMKLTAGTWRQKPELSGGGQIYDSGAHLLNTLVWTVEQPVEAVHAFLDDQGAPVEINGTINIRFENGVLATVMVSGNGSANGSSTQFIFDDARIECDGFMGRWIKVWKGKEEIEPELDTSTTNVRDNFIDAIQGRDKPRTAPINGIIQSELMEAIYESARTGQVARPVQR